MTHSSSRSDDDLEKQRDADSQKQIESANEAKNLTIVVCNGEDSNQGELGLPNKVSLSRDASSHEHCCRICQQEKEEEVLIELGCDCRGDLAKSHRSCVDAWFRTKGTNQCEICKAVAVNVTVPETRRVTNYWVWRIDPRYRQEDRERRCFSPLWIAFSILIGGLMLNVLISITLGVSALPVNIIIGVIVVLGLGTALRLTLEFCYEWRLRRAVYRAEANNFNTNIAYPPAL